jgi:hypothetical protein
MNIAPLHLILHFALIPIGEPLAAGMLKMKVSSENIMSLFAVLKLFDVTFPKIYYLLITQIVYNSFVDFMLISKRTVLFVTGCIILTPKYEANTALSDTRQTKNKLRGL